MAITKTKLKQLENSTTPGSFVAYDASNILSIIAPTTGADRIPFYDDSATAGGFLTLGTNLSISGTTLNATAGAGGYATVQEEGVTVGPGNTTLNFVGSGITVTDVSGTTTATINTFLNTLATAGNINLATVVTGTLPVANGGTGATTLTGLLQGNGTGAITAISNSSTVGQILRVTGASTYAWGALDLADTDAVTGKLPVANLFDLAGLSVLGRSASTSGVMAAVTGTANQVLRVDSGATTLAFGAINVASSAAVTGILANANGGTGFATYAVGDLLYADTTSTLARRAAVASGSVLKSAGVSTAPVWGTLASTDLSNTANIALLNATQTFSGTNTFSNNITMNGTPSASTDVVTVGYINNIVANGLKFHSVRGASTAALTISGRTATTLTVGGTSFVQDGVTFANGEYYLLKDNATGAGGGSFDNGAYVVSGVGSSIVLTRATYMDAAGEIDGHTFVIEDGTLNVGTIWITTSEVTTLGTDAIVFTQIQTSGTLTGSGANNQISVWSGTNSQDGNSTFTWDQTQMTVGTATPVTSTRVTTQGTGTGNTTFGLVHNNSSATNVFKIADDGTTSIGATTPLVITSTTLGSASNNITLFAASAITFQSGGGSTTGAQAIFDASRSLTSGASGNVSLTGTFNPTSGTATNTQLSITTTINQTGGANGITRGIHIAPTLTAVADYRGLEITASSSHYALWTTAGKVRHDLGSDADYDTWYRAATTGVMTRLANGTTGQVLTATTSGAPSWQAAAGGTITRAYLTGSTSSVIDLDSGTAVTDVDGSNITFTVPSDLDKTFVVRNGILLSRSGTVSRDYTLVSATGVLTLASALTSDESLLVYKIV